MHLLLFLLIALSSEAFAEDYYWNGVSGGSSYPSASSACQAAASLAWEGVGATLQSVTVDGYIATCTIKHPDGTPSTVYVYLNGDTCPDGGTYYPATGECTQPPSVCAERQQQGANKRFSIAGTAGPGTYATLANVNGKPMFVPVQTACMAGCQMSTVDQKCTGKTTGAFKCVGTAYYTGQPCTTSGTSSSPEPETVATSTAEPQPITLKTDKPCTYVVSGSTSTCQVIKGEDIEGQQCGFVNGVRKCYTKTPYKYENKIDTTSVKTTSGANTITTKTDKLTRTVCDGVNNCKTTTTTTVTKTTTKTTGGALVDSSSTCDGPDCANSGNPDANGDGFGDGSGDGDGDGEGDGEGDCAADEECSDEEVPGPSSSLAQGEQGSFDDANAYWDEQIETARDTLQTNVDQYANEFSGVFDLNLGSGAGSLPCEQVPITIGPVTQNLDMCLQQFSEPLGYLRFAILLAAAVLAALIILR